MTRKPDPEVRGGEARSHFPKFTSQYHGGALATVFVGYPPYPEATVDNENETDLS
jgi:hypothetical protein